MQRGILHLNYAPAYKVYRYWCGCLHLNYAPVLVRMPSCGCGCLSVGADAELRLLQNFGKNPGSFQVVKMKQSSQLCCIYYYFRKE